MDKTITTALLIVISVIMAMTLFNVAYPAVVEGGDAIARMASRAGDRMNSRAEIIHAASELGSGGWPPDPNGNLQFELYLWVKNTGLETINAVDSLDLFFGPEGNFTRIPHESRAGGGYPRWTGTVEGGTSWSPTTTLRITINYNVTPLAAGRYFAKITLPSGATAEYTVGL